jgi:SNF2 family DNA or RNA helicase
MNEYHWHAPSAPPVTSIDLRKKSAPAILNTDSLQLQPTPIATHRIGLDFDRPRAVSIAIARSDVHVRHFIFAKSTDAKAWATPAAPQTEEVPSTLPAVPEPASQSTQDLQPAIPSFVTRIKPPRDLVKLEDRLQYLLQPPLQSLLAEGDLVFPFRPFPFQFEGVAFLYPRQAAVLADEMGLGKTMQAITTMRLLLRRGEVQNVLLVCPKPLVTNWQREFGVWAPEVPVMVIEGDQAKRHWQWTRPDVPLRIANYELLLRDRDLFEGETKSETGESHSPLHFDLVVLDESQRIKNRESTTSEVVRSISRRRSWAMTGTPVENSAEDLVGIFEFLAPGFLSSDMTPRSMGESVRDYVIRRTKDQVLKELPPKLVHDEAIELSAEQRESYRMAEDEGVVRLTSLGESATIRHVFELVLRLKQICNFDPATGASAKLERLEADMEEIANSGRKAIVFSQWVQTIKSLTKHLHRFGPLEYHGKIPSPQRDGVIQRFREDPDAHVLLMSYGAGSVGLNLQFCNYVFLFDRWWNPAVEDQAINRAHRIGVDGPVNVTRFLMLETIEERIDRVLQEKRDLFDIIFSGGESRRKLGLTQEELFGLFQIKCPTGPIRVAA